MPEELRIVVVDEGGTDSPTQLPSAPVADAGGPQAATPAVPVVETGDAFRAASAGANVAGAAVTGNVTGAASLAGTEIAAVLGPVGIAAGAVTAAFGVMATAAGKFASFVESESSRLAGFSAVLTAAREQTALSRTFADFRRAQRIGPELATAERLRSRFEIALSDVGTEILRSVLQLVNLLEPVITTVTGALTALVRTGNTQIAMLTTLFGPVGLLIDALLRRFGVGVDDVDDDDELDPLIQRFLQGGAGNVNVGVAPVAPIGG